MELLICSLIVALVVGILVSAGVYFSGDPNESLGRVSTVGVLTSVFTGFGCGVFFALAGVPASGAQTFDSVAWGVCVAVLSGVAAIPSFFVVFSVAELLHRMRTAGSTRVLPQRYRRMSR